MLSAIIHNRFEKDIELCKKRGYDLQKIKDVMKLLIFEQPLDKKFKNHKLKGNYAPRSECHIEPDWLLIYRINKVNSEIIFERTGTHSDLF